MPGKERPAASRLAIQKPPTTEPHQRNLYRNTKPSAGRPNQANRRGSRLPIPSEPAPCHRPWITPQGATPAECHHNSKNHFEGSILKLAISRCSKAKQSRL